MIVHVLWTTERGWICNVYHVEKTDTTASVMTTHPLTYYFPDLNPTDPQSAIEHRKDIEAAILGSFPEARIEWGRIPDHHR